MKRSNSPQLAVSRTTTDPWIVLLGGHQLNAGLQSVAHRRGARLLVVDWNERPAVSGDRHLRLDIKDAHAVTKEVRREIGTLLFAYTSCDAATETAAQINAAHGLLRPPPGPLETARGKPAMNMTWRLAGLSSKRFRHCSSAREAIDFHHLNAPDASILKPAAGSSSRGITVIHRDDPPRALEAAFDRAAAIDPHGQAIVETYVQGTEFTAELLGDSAGNIQVLGISRKYHSPHAGRGRVANKLHYNASNVPSALQRQIGEFACRCFSALGLHTSLGHLELIATPGGELVPLELGARSSGFIATHLIDAAAGTEGMLLDAYERVLRGERIAGGPIEPRQAAMYFFYDFPPGVGRRADTSLMSFTPEGVASLASNRANLVPGRTFKPLDSEIDRPGFEILVGERDVLTIDAIEAAEEAHRRDFLAPAS